MRSLVMHLFVVIATVAATVTALPAWHDQEVDRFLAKLYASLDQPDFDKHDENESKYITDIRQISKIFKAILNARIQDGNPDKVNSLETDVMYSNEDTLPGGNTARNLDSIGGGNIVRNLDSLGGGNIVRNLDSIGGGNIVRNLDSLGGGNIVRNLDALGGGNIVRNLDALGGGNIVRNLDSLGGGNIVRNLDAIGGGNIVRNLDSLGGGNIVRQVSPFARKFNYVPSPRYFIRNLEQQSTGNLVKYFLRLKDKNTGNLDSLGGPHIV